MWCLGCLILEVFNGSLQKSSSLKSVGKIPGNLLSHYGELVSANPKNRPNPTKFLTQCKSKGQYLCNSFVDANLFLAELQVLRLLILSVSPLLLRIYLSVCLSVRLPISLTACLLFLYLRRRTKTYVPHTTYPSSCIRYLNIKLYTHFTPTNLITSILIY